ATDIQWPRSIPVIYRSRRSMRSSNVYRKKKMHALTLGLQRVRRSRFLSVVGDEDVEQAKARALKAAHVPEGMGHYFHVTEYRYPEFCADGVTPNPMNQPSRLDYDHVIEIHTGVNRSPEWGQYTGEVEQSQPGLVPETILISGITQNHH